MSPVRAIIVEQLLSLLFIISGMRILSIVFLKIG